ncbi:MAG TPA: hypothetical protein VG841_06310 [Caulobacterales bacterium]|nr:hypothetical protein [Caulobacterales bacterium]
MSDTPNDSAGSVTKPAGVVYGDASHVVGPALPLLVPAEEVNDSYVRYRKSKIDKARALLGALKKMDFDWQNVAIAAVAFGAGTLVSGWLASLALDSLKGGIIYIGGACLMTSGAVLSWATHKFRAKSVAQIAADVLECIPDELVP